MRRGLIFSIWLCACIALPVTAQDLPTGREARDLVFAERGAVIGEVFPHEALSESDVVVLGRIIETQKYYAAIAFSPGDGLASIATIAAANFHDEDNARIAALAGCDEVRTGQTPCVIVLIVRPEGWAPGQALQLNTDASGALRRDYRRIGSVRYLAISDSTGNWGMGLTLEDAMNECDEDDCRIAVADE